MMGNKRPIQIEYVQGDRFQATREGDVLATICLVRVSINSMVGTYTVATPAGVDIATFERTDDARTFGFWNDVRYAIDNFYDHRANVTDAADYYAAITE